MKRDQKGVAGRMQPQRECGRQDEGRREREGGRDNAQTHQRGHKRKGRNGSVPGGGTDSDGQHRDNGWHHLRECA